jgi:hypothetical protein
MLSVGLSLGEGNVEEESAREMIVMLWKCEVARRASRIWEPIVPLAYENRLVRCRCEFKRLNSILPRGRRSGCGSFRPLS